MSWRCAVGLALVSLACGGAPQAFRPVAVDLQGVSADAAQIQALWFVDAFASCAEVLPTNVLRRSADASARWTADDPERRLQLPSVEAERALLVVVVLDEMSEVLQLACRNVTFESADRGFLTPIRLQ